VRCHVLANPDLFVQPASSAQVQGASAPAAFGADHAPRGAGKESFFFSSLPPWWKMNEK
jgi:hypothetical protein